MMTHWRIGLVAGLAILGGSTVAEAQAPAGPGRASRGTSTATASRAEAGRSASATATASMAPSAAVPHRSVGSSYNRVTTTRRRSAYSGRPGRMYQPAAGAYAEDDPFRPYSAQARRSAAAAAASQTRPMAAPPPPPRMDVEVGHNYYPGLRTGRYPNANVARRHCTPSRGGVLSGSLGHGR